jgi:glycosyltransferase involved in cell wall biosynthesis
LAAQTLRDFECIVIDESSNEDTALACTSFCLGDPRFIYIRPSVRLGLAGSLNLGIDYAKSRLIARFDSDDICEPERLELQVEFLGQYPDIDVVGSAMIIIDDMGCQIGCRNYPLLHEDIVKRFIFTNAMAHPTIMFRKSILENSVSGYDATFKYAEDLEFWLRLLNNGAKFANLSSTLVRYRQQITYRNRENWTFNAKARIKNFSRPYCFEKIISILGIIVWAYLPKKTQQLFFKLIQYRKK